MIRFLSAKCLPAATSSYLLRTAVGLLTFVCLSGSAPLRAQSFGCNPAMANDIVCENSKQGNPVGEWSVAGAGDTTIQGFATDISVNQGGTISFKINTNARAYTITIFRLGYYGGRSEERRVGKECRSRWSPY